MKLSTFLIWLSLAIQATSVAATDGPLPRETLLKIEAKAAADFPGDPAKQAAAIESQSAAFAEIRRYKNKNVPAEILDRLKATAARDFPLDYGAQLSNVFQQAHAYKKLDRLSGRSFADVPAKLVERLKLKAARGFPLDYRSQLSIILQQVNSELKLGRYSGYPFASGIEKCKGLRHRLGNKGGSEYIYWGSLQPGSADVIYVVVKSNLGIIGQNFGFTQPDGTWEVTIWGDYHVGTARKETFYCEKF